MDILSVLGVIIGFGAILGGNVVEGGHLSALVNGPAALIVIGGTIGAALLQSTLKTYTQSLRLLVWVFFSTGFQIKANN